MSLFRGTKITVFHLCFLTILLLIVSNLYFIYLLSSRERELRLKINTLDSENKVFSRDLIKYSDSDFSNRMTRLSLIIENILDKNSTPDRQFRNDFDKAIFLRNYIYLHVSLKKTSPDFNFFEIDDAFLQSTQDKTTGHICGGLARLYIAALESQGIPARYVGIFNSTKSPYDSHATVEFYFQGNWYASDPTFNIMFKDKMNNFLSYQEVYKLITENKVYYYDSNNHKLLPGRDIQVYYIDFRNLMKYVIFYPVKVFNESEKQTKEYKTTILSPPTQSWDGIIETDNASQTTIINLNDVDRFYQILGEGIFR